MRSPVGLTQVLDGFTMSFGGILNTLGIAKIQFNQWHRFAMACIQNANQSRPVEIFFQKNRIDLNVFFIL